MIFVNRSPVKYSAHSSNIDVDRDVLNMLHLFGGKAFQRYSHNMYIVVSVSFLDQFTIHQ